MNKYYEPILKNIVEGTQLKLSVSPRTIEVLCDIIRAQYEELTNLKHQTKGVFIKDEQLFSEQKEGKYNK